MTRRERAIARLERRREWAESRRRKSDAGFRRASAIADNIPLGQPILVGHHSERHARRDQERIDSGMRAGVESMKMAEHHESKAAGIEAQLEGSIFSDDPDALERLAERIAELEAKRAKLKAINDAYRKGKGKPGWAIPLDPANAAFAPGDAPVERAFEALRASCPYEKKPVPSYQLSNLSGNIRRLKQRLVSIERDKKRQEDTEAAGGILIRESAGYASVRFAEYPGRDVVENMKTAGFHWSSGEWIGRADAVPESVRRFAADAAGRAS